MQRCVGTYICVCILCFLFLCICVCLHVQHLKWHKSCNTQTFGFFPILISLLFFLVCFFFRVYSTYIIFYTLLNLDAHSVFKCVEEGLFLPFNFTTKNERNALSDLRKKIIFVRSIGSVDCRKASLKCRKWILSGRKIIIRRKAIKQRNIIYQSYILSLNLAVSSNSTDQK